MDQQDIQDARSDLISQEIRSLLKDDDEEIVFRYFDTILPRTWRDADDVKKLATQLR